ncbi:MAG: Spy/CpxP family protein refolding chaperone [Cyanobacteria bacterium P01_H01_bin.119]
MNSNGFSHKRFLMGTVAAAALLVTPAAFKFAGSSAEAQRNQPFAELNLSEAQQAEIQSIREGTRAEIEGILSEEQKQQLAASVGNGERGNFMVALRSLDLTEAQQQQLRSLYAEARESMQAVLTPEQQAQVQEMVQGRREQRTERRGEILEQLDLTEAQQAELEAIRSNTRSQIEAVLTDEQQQQVAAAIESGGESRDALQSIELTDAQQQEIRSIMEGSREQMSQVLTDEQRQQLQESFGGPQSN